MRGCFYGKKRAFLTPMWGHLSWLIVNSEVKWVEESDRIPNFRNISNKTTFLFEMRPLTLQC